MLCNFLITNLLIAVPGDSLILDVSSATTDEPQVNQTLKCAAIPNRPVEEVKHVKKGFASSDLVSFGGKGRTHFCAVKAAAKGVGLLRILSPSGIFDYYMQLALSPYQHLF